MVPPDLDESPFDLRVAARAKETLPYVPTDPASPCVVNYQPRAAHPVSIGDVIADKYRVESVLGEGGMCVVFGARRVHFDDRVAIKVLRYEMAGQAEMVGRFVREGRASSRIKSHHVVRVIDVGSLPAGPPYLVLEYLEGQDLDALLGSEGRLPIAVAVDYVLQASEALAEAHLLGIVHRDLKPANLFLTRNADGSPWIKVFDFGISKFGSAMDPEYDAELTDATSVIGSPQYMSPEQLRSARDVDARSDLWSLGAILFELVTASTPFAADTVPELCASILREEPASMTKLRADCPRRLERVVMRCLQKDRTLRFQDVAELARALAPFASAPGLASVRRITGTHESLRPSSPSLFPATRPPLARKLVSSRSASIMAGLVVVAAVAVVVGGLKRPPTESARASVATSIAVPSLPTPTAELPTEETTAPTPTMADTPTFEMPESPNRARVPPMRKIEVPLSTPARSVAKGPTLDAAADQPDDLEREFGHRK